MSHCPRCQSTGRSVRTVTLAAQVLPARLAGLAHREGWRLCGSDSCDVVYFRDADVVLVGESRAIPFHKRGGADRLVCFCFGHSVADLEADVAASGRSSIQAAIKAQCRAGRHDCQRKNPQGRCEVKRCLAPPTAAAGAALAAESAVSSAVSASAEPAMSASAGATTSRGAARWGLAPAQPLSAAASRAAGARARRALPEAAAGERWLRRIGGSLELGRRDAARGAGRSGAGRRGDEVKRSAPGRQWRQVDGARTPVYRHLRPRGGVALVRRCGAWLPARSAPSRGVAGADRDAHRAMALSLLLR
jgi:hypothetical protein